MTIMYKLLRVYSTDKTTRMWLADYEYGALVVSRRGIIDEMLESGDYYIEFGLGTPGYKIELNEDTILTEEQIRLWPTSPRPEIKFVED